ncbi:MAG: hypothetical protein U9N77_05640 [Thermodesulfobacteriota bacterium]|nr:hypothetical protein [Thermodesulfobacteriota bacterium]
MEIEELVQTIVSQVLKQLNRTPEQEQVMEKECIMILEKKGNVKNEPVLNYLGDSVEVFYVDNEPPRERPMRYILPFLSCSGMAALAKGMAVEPVTEKVLSLFLAGRCVEVFEFEYKLFSQTAPDALYRLYESHEESLAAFGLKAVEVEENYTMRLRKKVVTEKDIIQAMEHGVAVLRIPADASITSLAVESAGTYDIQLLKG